MSRRGVWMMALAVVFGVACNSNDGGVSDGAVGDVVRGFEVGVDAMGPDGAPPPDGASADGPVPDGPVPDMSQPPDGGAPDAIPPPLSRGMKWVRQNPMFISGLTVTMGAPTAAAVSDYFSVFKATAVHLWQKGLPTAMDGWRLHGGATTRWVSWLKDDGTSIDGNKVIGGYPAGVPGRIGYQIGDEPPDMAHLKQIEVGVNAARGVDPDALVYVNFSYKANDIQQQLTYYAQMDADVVSYDSYTQGNKAYYRLDMFRQAGLKQGRPYWRYINAYFDKPPGGKTITESDMRWDAFSGLVYGYTGHTWFLYQIYNNNQLSPAFFDAGDSFAAAKTFRYALAAQINQELLNLGRCITQLTSTDVRYTPSVPLLTPQGTKPWQVGAGGDPYLVGLAPAPGQLLLDILVGFFVDDKGERYVMVQNVRHESGSWPIDNDNNGTFRLTFDFGKAPSGLDQTQVLGLDRVTGKVQALALTPLSGGKAQLDVTLAAGNPVLFKYATGVPFALGP